MTGAVEKIRDKLNEKLKVIFEAEPDVKEPKIFSGVRTLYQTCLDTKTVQARSVSDLLAVLTRLGGWPVLLGDAWSSSFSWHQFSVRAAREGFEVNTLFSLGED